MHTETIRIHSHGSADVLRHESVEPGKFAPSEVLARYHAIDLNFADIYRRKGQAGLHKAAAFPITLGSQGAGVIEAIGTAIKDVSVGALVGYVHPGADSKLQRIPTAKLVPLPDDVSFEVAAAGLLRGLTRNICCDDSSRLRTAAGGMGTMLSQWGKALGAEVIGTVSSVAKQQIAREHGCDHVINYPSDDFVARVDEVTQGAGVDVAYDAVGKAVFIRSLECLRPRGVAINYGAGLGPVGAFDIQLLHRKSLIVTRPTLRTYIARRENLLAGANALFDAMRSGASHRLSLRVGRCATGAHRPRAQQKTGAPVLLPEKARGDE